MVSVDKIKLIIWDLDETLWRGTVSEGTVEIIEDFASFIRITTDAGIVHSICSKNDFEVAKEKLQEFGLWDFFVFPSINWDPKGIRIKNTISAMNLRAENVLFIDDNVQNINEATYYNKALMVMLPSEALNLTKLAFPKSDPEHKRLKQYKTLEEKNEAQKNFSSNEDFLFSCNIRVTIYQDCETHIDRLHELLMRSNQLNYTKNRCSKEELRSLFHDSSVKSGYVTVQDNFGDYGIVGFFCVKENKAIHYLFSCRTLGMLVEQYVYMLLGCPEIEVTGEVVTALNKQDVPAWINQKHEDDSVEDEWEKGNITKSVLFKGPCDISQIFSFIKEKDNLKHEFTYINDLGLSIEGHNHCAQIASSLSMNQQEKETMLSQCAWMDKNCFDTQLVGTKFHYLVLSMVTDVSLGLYRNKETNRYYATYYRKYDITRKEFFSKFKNEKLQRSKIKYDVQDFELFSEKFEYVPNDGFAVTMQSLSIILEELRRNGTKLILLLASEKKYPGKTALEYQDREKEHRELNSLIRVWAEDKDDVVLMSMDDYITDDKCYLDTINHFKKIVYYNAAKDLVGILNKDEAVEMCDNGTLYKQVIKEKLRPIVTFIRKSIT